MKTVRDACQLQPNALSVKLSDQIEQLDEMISAEGNGTAFFDRTFITQGMKDLITEGIARLAGASSQAVFHLKQAMGGGKTHLLVGFGLLARHAALRATYCAGMTQREWVAELAEYLAKRLDALRPIEASAARVLRELVKNQRLG